MRKLAALVSALVFLVGCTSTEKVTQYNIFLQIEDIEGDGNDD